MTRPVVVPIAGLARRLPEAGRLRTGVRTAKAAKAIPTWRATSIDEDAIRQIAAHYGGTPVRWRDAPTEGQWEVITEAAELRVVLPPDPLGGSPIYELWSGGGCQRRCDGDTAQVVSTSSPDGPEMEDVPCICSATGTLSCRPVTRLSVILPDVRFGGTWRYQSSTSMAVAIEMPAMVALVQSLQERGLTRAVLGIEPRKTVRFGKTHRFTIPVLRVPETLDGLVAGAARVAALSPGERPELSAVARTAIAAAEPVEGDTGDGGWDADDRVVDAELVADEGPVAEPEPLPESVTAFCSLCRAPYGSDPLRKGLPGQSKLVHRACAEKAAG